MELSEDVRLVLKYAAEEIKEHGWCQRKKQDEVGRLCLVGALEEATKRYAGALSPTLLGPAIEAVARAVPEEIRSLDHYTDEDINGLAITRWNDLWATSADEAVGMLEKAAVS